MAYMGRGGFSGFSGGNNTSLNNNTNNIKKRLYHRRGLFGLHYYIPLDNTYVIFQMVITFIILITIGITILVTYAPSIIDPLESTKNTIITSYMITIFSLIVFTILSNCLSKQKKSLIKKLVAILSIAVISIFVFLGIKANLDSTYTKEKFAEIYSQEYGKQNSTSKSKIDIGLTGMQIKTEKEHYIDECMNAYSIFNIRLFGMLALNLLIIILLIYQISKVIKIQEKMDKMSKDDTVLFDEEENIKF